MNLVIIRHAENKKKPDPDEPHPQDHIDTEIPPGKLTTVGQLYAAQLPAETKLRNIVNQISVIYSSDTSRCLDTVKPLAESAGCSAEVKKFKGEDSGYASSLPTALEVMALCTAPPDPADPGKWAVVCCRSLEMEREIEPEIMDRLGDGLDPDEVEQMFAAQSKGYDMYVAFSGQDAEGKYHKAKAFHLLVPEHDEKLRARTFHAVPDNLKKGGGAKVQ